MTSIKRALLPAADAALAPVVRPAAWLLGQVRRVGVDRLPACRRALLDAGVFPIRDHYYEPRFDFRRTRRPLGDERPLPGIDLNVGEQLELLAAMTFAGELADVPRERPATPGFYMGNLWFGPGDAEFWYQLVRLKKPARIFEVGSGNSTLAAIRAIERNRRDDPAYTCEHVCIEPYEMPWLERTTASVIRRPVEELDPAFFSELEAGDVLFIDSSHVIRPEGDVLFEFLEVLPALRPGVIVHVHDVFTPRDYPAQWLAGEVRLWNEQYLLEAFLTHNDGWKIIAALNYLRHHHEAELGAVAPFVTHGSEPGSFYLEKRS